MTRDDLNRLAIVARAMTEGDVRPEDVPALDYGPIYGYATGANTRIEIPGAGWTERETGLPPPDEGSFVTGLLWGGLIALALWVIGISALWWGMKAGWIWR
jgi:hypothetical protein